MSMSVERTAGETANLALVQRVYAEVLGPLDSTRVDELFAPDYRQHSPLANSGTQALKDFLDWARTTSPLAEHHVKRLFADGDHVIAHVHVIIEPGTAGNAVVDIFRIKNDRIAEHWDVMQPVPDLPPGKPGMF
jgi:predicted SnoaL-like aldol condensation-catalyzing enzyme